MYMIMAQAEDGTELRATDREYKTIESAERDLEEAIENYPCSKLSIEWVNTRAEYDELYRERLENDSLDLY